MFTWEHMLSGTRAPVMGVVNVTPDSFSDGGRFLDPDVAVAHGLSLVADGAGVLDVGGESTRPGAEPVGTAEELRRVIPVIRRLVGELGGDRDAVPVSVDTTKAAVAAAALDAGAVIVNDISAGRNDRAMLGVVAESGAGYVAMHMLGEPRTMQVDPHYGDVVGDVADFLVERLGAARAAGIAAGSLMVDPGIGFGKRVAHNLELIARLPELAERVDAPLLVGTSRKAFIGTVLGDSDPKRREEGTLATVTWALDHGAALVRVHDVRASVLAARLLHVMEESAA
ncbi:MAG: dihydropteroate synthase [Acidimicrobiia bacterium]